MPPGFLFSYSADVTARNTGKYFLLACHALPYFFSHLNVSPKILVINQLDAQNFVL